jgi:hypothetical protein
MTPVDRPVDNVGKVLCAKDQNRGNLVDNNIVI